jgi:hypothetical protein
VSAGPWSAGGHSTSGNERGGRGNAAAAQRVSRCRRAICRLEQTAARTVAGHRWRLGPAVPVGDTVDAGRRQRVCAPLRNTGPADSGPANRAAQFAQSGSAGTAPATRCAAGA